ncbi:hypothetical protein H5410_016336 [Solanum commersonii]|uniref:Uncharacterized protein n=1 Tax=Solanum commersonii TaxID=4109 RepID=A0A9J5ZWA7_SOLCO|nr:hypothetical protein H5410_016336 [Solanum commersonii]
MFLTIEVQPFVTFAVDSIKNRRGTLFCRSWIKTWEIKVFLIQQTPGKQEIEEWRQRLIAGMNSSSLPRLIMALTRLHFTLAKPNISLLKPIGVASFENKNMVTFKELLLFDKTIMIYTFTQLDEPILLQEAIDFSSP